MQIFRQPLADKVRPLLLGADLPASDLADPLEHFFGCGAVDDPDGIVGLELFDGEALLRSLVVRDSARTRGCGSALVAAAEEHARHAAVERIWLLTETAEEFFRRRGYRKAERIVAPPAIRQTSEFSALCPASAVLMTRHL